MVAWHFFAVKFTFYQYLLCKSSLTFRRRANQSLLFTNLWGELLNPKLIYCCKLQVVIDFSLSLPTLLYDWNFLIQLFNYATD